MSFAVGPEPLSGELSPTKHNRALHSRSLSDDDPHPDTVSIPDSAIDLTERDNLFKETPKKTDSPRRVASQDSVGSKSDVSAGKGTVTIKLPNLFSSVVSTPARINPFWGTHVSKESDEWAKEVMKLDDRTFSRLRKAQFPLLAATFVPEADAEGYRIVCDFMEWVFFFDDLFDEGELREDPAAARDELEAHLAIHNDDHPDISAEEFPVRHMYQVVWKKIKSVATLAAQRRYIEGMRHYFEGCMVQVDAHYWTTRGYTPTTFDMFWRGRTHSVGCRPCQALLEPLHHITLPDEVWTHPAIKEAEDTATFITFLHNDILSYRKEQAEPEAVPHNTIHVLQRERGYTLQDAFDYAGELLKQEFQRWHWTQQHLPSWGEHVDIQVQRYLEGLLDGARGNLHWSFATGRYFGKDSESARKTMTLEMPLRD